MEELSKYREIRHVPENINIKHRQRFNFQDKVALHITKIVGTMYAVYFFALFILGWMFWQTFVLDEPFDPFPFVFLLFLGNIIQLFLMPLILVGQNLQGRHAEIRAEEEYKTTQSSYKDIEQILLHLDDQDKKTNEQLKLLLELSNKISAKV